MMGRDAAYVVRTIHALDLPDPVADYLTGYLQHRSGENPKAVEVVHGATDLLIGYYFPGGVPCIAELSRNEPYRRDLNKINRAVTVLREKGFVELF